MLNFIWFLALCNYSVSSEGSSGVNLSFLITDLSLVATLGGFTNSSESWAIHRV